jgi:hypothetical protein
MHKFAAQARPCHAAPQAPSQSETKHQRLQCEGRVGGSSGCAAERDGSWRKLPNGSGQPRPGQITAQSEAGQHDAAC